MPLGFRAIAHAIYYFGLDLAHYLRYGTPDMFGTVQIETNSSCNRACIYCPNSVAKRANQSLSLGDIGKILLELKEMKFKGVIVFSGYNEPLMDPRLNEIAELTRNSLPENRMIIYTNGDNLDERWMKIAGMLRIELNVTLHDGGAGEERIKRLLNDIPREMKRRIYIKKDLTRTALSTRGGLVEVPQKFRRSACRVPSSELTIMSDGNVVLCSDDFNSTVVFGNIKNDSIAAIWGSEKYRRVRREIRKGNFFLPICRHCAG